MEKHFALYTIYNDRTEKEEKSDSIINILEAAAIYLRDPNCRHVIIEDLQKDEFIFNFWNK